MNILIVNNQTFYLESVKNMFINHSIKILDYSNLDLDKINEFDLIVLTGGHSYSVANHPEIYKKEIELIKTATISIVGICLGFELIVYAFGGVLKKLENKEEGIVEIYTNNSDPILKDVNKIRVFENHRWIATSLPQNLVELAKSKDGIEIVKHKTKLIYGFQFHPEIIEDKNDLKIFSNLIKFLKKN